VLIHAYCDAAGSDQNLAGLKDTFEAFARRTGHRISAFYNQIQPPPATRTSLFRLLRNKGLAIAAQASAPSPRNTQTTDELFRMLQQARPNDVVLFESVHFFSRLSGNDWQKFRRLARERKVRVVSLDVEASWVMVTSESAMTPVAGQLTAMMLDTIETLAIEEKRTKRSRQLEGIAKAKSSGKYKGRPIDHSKHDRIRGLLEQGHSWSEVCEITGASRSTVARVVKAMG
jgi:DNA invertase Pin-like site-specific DNA recombinase